MGYYNRSAVLPPVLVQKLGSTIGCRIAGVRVVDLYGDMPALWRLSLRLIWWFLGPVNVLLDLLFMTNDPARQTLRDKLMGTYVVKRQAQPAGKGRRVLRYMHFMGMSLMYPEIVVPQGGKCP